MRALVLSGGGSKGAYEAGAIQCLLGDKKISYDIICGVSVGALNGAFLAQYANGQEEIASMMLGQLWSQLNTSKIYKHWFGWWLAALWRPSMYNSKPLQDLVRSKLDIQAVRHSGKKLRMGAVSLKTGKYRLFDENYSDLSGAVLASSAFPAMLTPIQLDGELWTDGGVRDVTPFQAAVDLGASSIDVIMCSPEYLQPRFPAQPNVIGVAKRAIDILADEASSNDIDKAYYINKLIQVGAVPAGKRHIEIRIIRPIEELTDDSLNFDPILLKFMRQQGYKDASRLFDQ
jgi:NTE family protein